MKEIYRKIKKFIQRGKRGWSDEDTWDFDSYLSEVISSGCKHLADITISYPTGMGFRKWKRILNKISKDIVAPIEFDNSVSNMGNYNQQSKEAYKKQSEALKLLVKHFNDLWD